MDNWLKTYNEKLYIISKPEVLKVRPELSEKANEFVTAITKTKKDEDLLWISGRYCTADVRNGNGDGFKLADLERMYAYAIFKPINWLHNENEKIGFIVDSELKEAGDEVYVEITGVIWCSTRLGASYANKVIDYYDKDQLGLSMETMGNAVMCSECGQEFPTQSGDTENPYGHYCEHLKGRRLTGVTRWILNPEFSGVGVIPSRGRQKPADKDAWVNEIASLNENEDTGEEDEKMAEKNEVTYSKKQVDELVNANEIAVRKEYDSLEGDLKAAKESKEKLEAKILDMTDEAGIKEGELTQAKDEVKTVTEAKNKLQTTVDTYDKDKTEAEQAKFDGRVKELKEINASVTEEVAEKIREDILDDTKFDSVKAMFTKTDDKEKPIKPALETPTDEPVISSDAAKVKDMLRLETEEKSE